MNGIWVKFIVLWTFQGSKNYSYILTTLAFEKKES